MALALAGNIRIYRSCTRILEYENDGTALPESSSLEKLLDLYDLRNNEKVVEIA